MQMDTVVIAMQFVIMLENVYYSIRRLSNSILDK